ncbi:hypothetical protein BCV70DRAFT_199209 [Testicularia cyperi]|uniref:Uncharacterized protein n=1 Tax=Testicularia cyperi TaxID=1882483 RepID=A0A317XR60_9BASI|nr:hypothetical protein BCV70DRAFT_199209 [Testicularia cyperi]
MSFSRITTPSPFHPSSLSERHFLLSTFSRRHLLDCSLLASYPSSSFFQTSAALLPAPLVFLGCLKELPKLASTPSYYSIF